MIILLRLRARLTAGEYENSGVFRFIRKGFFSAIVAACRYIGLFDEIRFALLICRYLNHA